MLPRFTSVLLAGSLLLGLGQCATTVETEKPATARSGPRVDSAGTLATAAAAPESIRKTAADYRLELRAAEAALRAQPRNFDALLARAKAQTQLHNYPEALTDYNLAARLQPAHAEVYYHRGLAQLKLRRYPAAVNDFTKALQHNPADKDAYFGRGAAHMQLFQFKAAIPDFTQALQLDSAFADAYEYRGISYASLNLLAAAQADLEKAVQLNPAAIKSLRRYVEQ